MLIDEPDWWDYIMEVTGDGLNIIDLPETEWVGLYASSIRARK